MKSATISKNERKLLLDHNRTVYYQTKIAALQDINGWRPGKIHLFIAPKGTGKSTLVRTVVKDVVENNEQYNIGAYLSEETETDFLTELHRDEIDAQLTDRIFLASDLSYNYTTAKDWLKNFERVIRDLDLIILDNLTTLAVYESLFPGQQTIFCTALKKIIQQKNIPCVVIAHTGSQIKAGQLALYGSEEIRGSKAIDNLSEFTYTLHQLNGPERKLSFLKGWKSRGQEGHYGLYRLNYDKELRVYDLWTRVNHEHFEKVLKDLRKGN